MSDYDPSIPLFDRGYHRNVELWGGGDSSEKLVVHQTNRGKFIINCDSVKQMDWNASLVSSLSQ